MWLVKGVSPPVWEPNYELWPGEGSQPTFPVTIDPAVPMTARAGTTLMNYVARPVGDGPFGVVLERTLRLDKANGEFWASRGATVGHDEPRQSGQDRAFAGMPELAVARDDGRAGARRISRGRARPVRMQEKP